jgi:mannose-6-phosphate isomerase
VPLLLNAVVLAPGEALIVRPGTVHAYLSGTGVEVMTPSDNVVRGGLTAKHVDPDELRAVTLPRARPAEVLRSSPGRGGVTVYGTGTPAFTLARLQPGETRATSGADATLERTAHGVAVLVCVAGAVEVRGGPDGGDVLAMAAGEAVLVPARVEGYGLMEAGAGSCVFEVSAPPR